MTSLRYRTATYVPVPAWRRWWPLASQEFRTLFRSKWGVATFCVCLIPLAVRMFVLMITYGVVNFGAGVRGQLLTRSQAFAQWDPGRAEFYVEGVLTTFPGLPILVLLSATVTAGAVARDRTTNALELFWTRGISPFAYLFAKWLGSTMLLASITVAGPLFLWLAAALLAEDWTQLTSTLPFLLPTLGGLLLVTAVWTASCVMLSALCSAPSQAVVSWCVLMLGSTAVASVTAAVFRDPTFRSWLSLWDACGVVARASAGVATRGAPLDLAVAFLVALLVVQWLLARRRLSMQRTIG